MDAHSNGLFSPFIFQIRLEWCRGKMRYRLPMWKRVHWSDECSFNLTKRNGNLRAWRRRGERYHEDNIAPNRASGRVSVNVWGCVANDCKMDLVNIHGGLTAQKYTGDPLHSRAACTQPCNVNTHSRAHCSRGARLCEQWVHGCVNNGTRLCASARLCRGSPVKYVDEVLSPHVEPHIDNTRLQTGLSSCKMEPPPHYAARISTDFLTAAAIDVLLWPAKSPDINIIENIWSSMSRFINGMKPMPRTVAELRTAVHISWQRESQARIRRLVASVPRRLRAIVDAQGGHVNY